MTTPGEERDTPPDGSKRKRANLAIALALFAFVVLVFIITIARMGGRVFENGGM